MRITFYDATPGGVEAFIICYACISTNTLGSTNKYVLFVFAFVFVCVDLLLLLLLRAGTRGAAFELLCVVASGNILTHSQLPLLPQLRTLSPYASSQPCPLRLRQGIFSRRRLCELRLRQKLLCPVPKKLHVARTISQ